MEQDREKEAGVADKVMPRRKLRPGIPCIPRRTVSITVIVAGRTQRGVLARVQHCTDTAAVTLHRHLTNYRNHDVIQNTGST